MSQTLTIWPRYPRGEQEDEKENEEQGGVREHEALPLALPLQPCRWRHAALWSAVYFLSSAGLTSPLTLSFPPSYTHVLSLSQTPALSPFFLWHSHSRSPPPALSVFLLFVSLPLFISFSLHRFFSFYLLLVILRRSNSLSLSDSLQLFFFLLASCYTFAL